MLETVAPEDDGGNSHLRPLPPQTEASTASWRQDEDANADDGGGHHGSSTSAVDVHACQSENCGSTCACPATNGVGNHYSGLKSSCPPRGCSCEDELVLEALPSRCVCVWFGVVCVWCVWCMCVCVAWCVYVPMRVRACVCT